MGAYTSLTCFRFWSLYWLVLKEVKSTLLQFMHVAQFGSGVWGGGYSTGMNGGAPKELYFLTVKLPHFPQFMCVYVQIQKTSKFLDKDLPKLPFFSCHDIAKELNHASTGDLKNDGRGVKRGSLRLQDLIER